MKKTVYISILTLLIFLLFIACSDYTSSKNKGEVRKLNIETDINTVSESENTDITGLITDEIKASYRTDILKDNTNAENKDFVFYAENIKDYQLMADNFISEIKSCASLASVKNGIDIYTDVIDFDYALAMTLSNFYPKGIDAEELPFKIEAVGDRYFFDMDFSDKQAFFRQLAGDDIEKYLNMRVFYGYIITVYDENGKLLDGKQDLVDLPEWIFPLNSYTRFRDSWFKDRDKGSRRHLGTDISAKEGTEIYSVTDATVLYIGSGTKAGNCVLTVDEEGNEYLYCHMVKESDFLKPNDKLKQGDLVGYVGNTGNSDVNHLHLSVILKDGRHLWTYPYLKDAWDNNRLQKEMLK